MGRCKKDMSQKLLRILIKLKGKLCSEIMIIVIADYPGCKYICLNILGFKLVFKLRNINF